AYEQISPKRLKRVIIAVVIGFFLSIGLGILLFMVFVENWQYYFDQLISQSKGYINPIMAYILGSGLYTLNAASPFFVDIFSAFGTEIEDMLGMMVLPAILTWFITGFTMGFICKKWEDGFLSGIFCGLVTWVFLVVGTRIAIFGSSTFGPGELFFILAVFMMLVNSAAAILICIGGGVLGALFYSKVLYRKKAMIEEYM
ncbi:MAG: hypothetical protein HWN66_21615, partial [Candidatus Helarchaeota archaeon]|nr:hypothetical protein [Candidatus Helarchaeota archaeon]